MKGVVRATGADGVDLRKDGPRSGTKVLVKGVLAGEMKLCSELSGEAEVMVDIVGQLTRLPIFEAVWMRRESLRSPIRTEHAEEMKM